MYFVSLTIPLLLGVCQIPFLFWVCHNECMTSNFRISESDKPDGLLVSFGPLDPDTGWQLQIPKTFTRKVSYEELGLDVKISCTFTGQKVEIRSLTVTSADQEVTSRSLTQLALPEVIYEATLSAIPESKRWDLSNKKTRLEYGSVDSKSLFIAQLYWLEHVSSGTPRAAIMNYLNAPRPTVNQWLREFKKSGNIPTY